jgi:hypothetical protein
MTSGLILSFSRDRDGFYAATAKIVVCESMIHKDNPGGHLGKETAGIIKPTLRDRFD